MGAVVLRSLSLTPRGDVVFPPLRYYEYVFGSSRRQWPGRGRQPGTSELTGLQVWITSPDSECDAYPAVTSDESCESHCLYFLVSLVSSGQVQSPLLHVAKSNWWPTLNYSTQNNF